MRWVGRCVRCACSSRRVRQVVVADCALIVRLVAASQLPVVTEAVGAAIAIAAVVVVVVVVAAAVAAAAAAAAAARFTALLCPKGRRRLEISSQSACPVKHRARGG